MANIYRVYNSAVPTTAAMTPVATGTAIKTLLQITASATNGFQIISWGIDFETVPTAHVHCQLINTTTVAGTGMTAVTATPLQDGPASGATCGFSPSAEGSVAATTRVFDTKLMMSNSYTWEWSLGREPELQSSQVLRVRVITATTINALCWVCWSE